jgi:polysaccharide biosynthesis/export protein
MLQTVRYLYFICLFAGFIHFCSCTPSKQVVYLYDLGDTTSANAATLYEAQSLFETPIQKNDQLWITVGGSNAWDLPVINSGSGAGTGGGGGAFVTTGNSVLGYLVEADGKIQFPNIGRVQAEGFTRTQLEIKLAELLKDYTKNPVVNVRFLNYFVSVLGEVNKSGRYPMPTERITILEAITLAGDITDLGKRDNVLLIREVNGKRTFSRIDLTSKSLFQSPNYYLRSNDVVYVEPVKAKFISRSGAPQYVSLIAVGLSLILTIINVTQKK